MPSPHQHIVDVHPNRQRPWRPMRKGPGASDLLMFGAVALLYVLA